MIIKTIIPLSRKFFNSVSIKCNSSNIKIEEKLRGSLYFISHLDVSILNGDCGEGLSIKINCSEFKGKSLLDQHRMVNEILKEEFKLLHSVIVKTKL